MLFSFYNFISWKYILLHSLLGVAISQGHMLLFESEGCFLLKLVFYFIADIDECKKMVNGVISKGGCQHKCNNTIGSYSCSCNDGFVLAYDRRTCLGITKFFSS